VSKKNDMMAALERRQPAGAVPIWEVEFQAWDAASGKHVVLGREFEALSVAGQERAMYANAEILLAVCDQLRFAALTAPNAYWEHAPGQLAYYCLPGDTRFRQLEILRELAPKDVMFIAITGGVMGGDYAPEYCYRLMDDPSSVDEMAENTLRGGIKSAQRFRDCGAEAVVSPSDMADNLGPFYSPEQMQRWVLPYMTRWADSLRAMGLYSILHTDGNLTRYMDTLASTGIDAIQAIDPVAGMDMRKTKDIVGSRLCLCGNIDCGLLVRGTPQTVYDSTRNLLAACKPGGGLVLGASNAVQPDVPIENYRAMIRAWQDHGQYQPSRTGQAPK
jgi:uroporphyrinogen decarboxylase